MGVGDDRAAGGDAADYQARVVGLLESSLAAMPGVGYLIGGVLTAVGSPRTAYAVAGIGTLVLVLVALGRCSAACGSNARARRRAADPEPPDAPALHRPPTPREVSLDAGERCAGDPLDHVALTVSDRERPPTFYAEHFGLDRSASTTTSIC